MAPDPEIREMYKYETCANWHRFHILCIFNVCMPLTMLILTVALPFELVPYVVRIIYVDLPSPSEGHL